MAFILDLRCRGVLPQNEMNELIKVNVEKCVGCNACVRTCPAPEANITKQLQNGNFITTVDTSKCIACGECVRNCAHGAREYLDDTEIAINDMKNKNMIVIAAPAIKSVFPKNWKGILSWFREQGCKIFDVSFGADICTWAHLRTLQSGKANNLISQPCAAIVKYIEIYQPDLLKNLSPIHSPMLCAVTYIRKYLNLTAPIIALSPCIAKKNEFLETRLVDYNVTFKKLSEYFERKKIKFSSDFSSDFAYDFDGEQGQVGGIYPRAGGLRDNLWLHDPEINITTSEGVHKVYPELDMYATLPEHMKPSVFDVLSCEFGCNVGPGTGSNKTIFEVMKTMREVEQEAKSRRKVSGGFFRGAEDKLFKKFDEELNINDFFRKYSFVRPTRTPTYDDLKPIFNKMGKHSKEEQEYNCHACGYRSCKEMAIAIYRGLNTPDNCIVHAKSVLLAHHSELAKKHEQLFEIAEKCKELSDEMHKNMTNIAGNVTSIRIANKNTIEQADEVKNFLSNVIGYCKNNKTMNEDSMIQLVTILDMTIGAFENLYTSVSESTGETRSVDDYISEINGLVDEINTILKDIENV